MVMTEKTANLLIISPSSSWQEVLAQCTQPALSIISLPDVSVLEGVQMKPDIILMDLSPEVQEGSALTLQQVFPEVPVVALSAQQPNLPDGVTLLHKPIHAEALFECIAAYVLLQETPLALGELYLFTRGKYLSKEKQSIPDASKLKLTEKEVEILSYLFENKEKVVDKEALLSHIWGYGEGIDTHTVETHIYRLRQKVADQFDGREILMTTEGGYILQS